LCENGENKLAKEITRSVEPLQVMKETDRDRYIIMETIVRCETFDASTVYFKQSKEQKRKAIADTVMKEVTTAEPSRLLALLQQAVNYQQENGKMPKEGKFDLFNQTKKNRRRDEESVAQYEYKSIHSKSNNESIQFLQIAPNAMNLILSRRNFQIEFWDTESYSPRLDLSYQQSQEYLFENAIVSCATFSKDGDFVAIGLTTGEIKLWKISTGKCMRSFAVAHTTAVSSIIFSKDGTQLLSGGYDNTAKLHGLKSGKTLKEFR
jgi:WD40 repeat-containing protein SMU1